MEIVTKIAPIILALIMLGLGLGLKVEDFARVFKAPKDFIVGFISQLIILPIVAYLLIIICEIKPTIKSFGNLNTLVKSSTFKPNPRPNIINASIIGAIFVTISIVQTQFFTLSILL